MTGRTYLASDSHLGGYRRVFEIEGGLEIDENNFTEIERTRVYFDDVLGMTYHQQSGVAYLILTGITAAFLAGIAILIAVDGQPEAAIAMACTAAPFAIVFMLRLLLKVDIITVFGKRTKARMKFSFRKGRARQIYRDLTLKIQASQQKADAAQPRVPAAPELPLPPSPPSAPEPPPPAVPA